MKKTGYAVNHAEGKIILTKEFNKRAGIPNTPEYNAMLQLRKDFPTYTATLKTISHKLNKRTDAVTYDKMIEYITEKHGKDSPELTAFKEAQRRSRNTTAPYIYMKKWFKEQYPDYKVNVNEADVKDEQKGGVE